MLWAVAEDDLVVEVRRGENAKRKLPHAGVVRTLVARKRQSGGAGRLTMVTRGARMEAGEPAADRVRPGGQEQARPRRGLGTRCRRDAILAVLNQHLRNPRLSCLNLVAPSGLDRRGAVAIRTRTAWYCSSRRIPIDAH